MKESNAALKKETAKPTGPRHESLGNILVRKGLLSPADLDRMIVQQRSSSRRLGDLLVEARLVEPDEVSAAIAEQLEISCLRNTDLIHPEPSALELLSAEQANKYNALPLALVEDRLQIAMSDPLDLVSRDELEKITGRKLLPVICADDLLAKAIEASYLPRGDGGDEDLSTQPASDSGDVNLDDLRVLVNDSPIVKLVNSLIVKAIRDLASDIHFEPQKKRLRIRYRIDGILYPLASVSRDLAPVVTSRIKILSNMDIGERRLPQDGRFTVVFDKKEVDLRVSSLPGIFGEKIVLRILIKDSLKFDFDELGFSEAAREILRRHIHRPQGMVLLTGPTGSGKTTTLYTCLSEIDRNSLNVVTLEDPVEYQVTGIHQVHINSRIGLTFAAGLRTILRQDPDVIMVGEIRDKDTAEMAIRAALTGHLVFSTLHTNDATGTLTRLVNMGIEPFLVAESVSLVGAQRLVRANCPSCVEPYSPDPAMLDHLGIEPDGRTFLRGKGCSQCRNIGYRGRVAIVELAEMTGALREIMLRGEHAIALREAAVKGGMRTLRDDGVEKALNGRTTLEEVIRVCAEA